MSGPRRIQMPLPFDVLFIIVSLLERRSDLLSCMRTDRILYSTCVHILLRSPVILTGNNAIASFFYFMHADGTTRFPLLRNLRLLMDASPSFSSIDHLARIVAQATNLEQLDIGAQGGFICGKSPAFVDAFLGLTRLKTLRFTILDDFLPPLIPLLKSALINVDLAYIPGPEICDPIPMLAPFQLTLESLRIAHFDTVSTNVVFPRMRSLALANVDHDMASLQSFVSIFPNLRELRLEDSQLQYTAGRNSTELGLIQAQNKWQQEAHHWPRLDRLSGSVLGIVFYAVVSPVQELELEGISLSNGWIPDLSATLRDMRPSRLTLHVMVYYPEYFPLLFPSPISFAYLHLNVKISFSSTSDVDLVLTSILKMAEMLSVRDMKLKIISEPRYLRNRTVGEVAPDPAAVAQRFMQVIPALEGLKLDLPDCEPGLRFKSVQKDGMRTAMQVVDD